MRDVRAFEDLEALSHASAEVVVAELRTAIEARSSATLALAGGETPKRLYEMLAANFHDDPIWQSTHFFLGDERCVPSTDPKSNLRMIQESLLNPLRIPAAQVHHPNTALASPNEIANAYEKDLRNFFGAKEPGFDLILLGMGADGHTASIFPETLIDAGNDGAVIATVSPILPRDRVTVTMRVINHSNVALLQVSGKTKAAALAQVLALANEPNAPLPAARIHALTKTLVFIDRD
jgi:6-phosphogluconolactonase